MVTLGTSSTLRAFHDNLCDLRVDSITKTIFVSLTMSVIFFRDSLLKNLQLFVQYHNSDADSYGNPSCLGDGRVSLLVKNCQRKVMNLPSLNYKLFTIVIRNIRRTTNSLSSKPFFSIKSKLININTI